MKVAALLHIPIQLNNQNGENEAQGFDWFIKLVMATELKKKKT